MSRAVDGLAIAAGALAVYVFLGQHTFYKLDGPDLVLMQEYGQIEHHLHPLYMPIAAAFRAVAPVRGPYAACVLLSAVATAAAVWLSHAFFTRELDRAGAALAAIAVAACPVNVFFATVVEFHAVYLPFAVLAWIAMQRSHPIVLGVAIAVAQLAHSSGNLLCMLLGLWILAKHRASYKAIAAAALSLVVALGLGLILVELCETSGLMTPSGSRLLIFKTTLAEPHHVADLPGVVWHEWLVGLAPLSVLAWFGLGRRETRNEALALLGALVPYLGLCFLIVANEPERGAYLAPLSIGAAWLTVRCAPRAVAVAAVAAGLVFGIVQVMSHDRPEIARAYAGVVAGQTGAKPAVLLAGTVPETEATLIARPEMRPYPLYIAAAADASLRDRLPPLPAFLAQSAAAGRSLWLSLVGLRFLEDPESFGVGRATAARAHAMLDDLKGRYALVPHGGLFELRLR